jgi:hypothetical protein
MKFSIAQGNCAAVRRPLKDKTSVMIAGTESNEKFDIYPTRFWNLKPLSILAQY